MVHWNNTLYNQLRIGNHKKKLTCKIFLHSLTNNSLTSGFMTPVSRVLSFIANILRVLSRIISLSSASSENNASIVAKEKIFNLKKYFLKISFKCHYQQGQFDIKRQLNCAQQWLQNCLLIEEFEQEHKQFFAQLLYYPCKCLQDLWLLAFESEKQLRN